MYKVASLFCGTGGLDLGFLGGFTSNKSYYERLPFEIVLACDIDQDAVDNYNENSVFFNEHQAILGDVRDINYEEISDFDILLAGFPCQPFSNAGNRKGVLDDRGTLFEEVIRAVSNKKPKVILMENVRGITSSKMPDGKKVLDEISDRLRNVNSVEGAEINYSLIEHKLVKASDFGVPQDRYRVLIIAVRDDLNIDTNPFDLIENYIKDFDSEELKVKNIIVQDETLPNSEDVWHLSPQAMGMVPHIKRSWKDIPYDLLPDRLKKIRDNMKKYKSPNFYRRFGLEEVNGTITASAQPEKCGILHPLENRRYSVREIARIQSFPDDFTFNSPAIVGKYKVIGNAVPPVLGHTAARIILDILEGKIVQNNDESIENPLLQSTLW